ncbi:MAG: non-homologous end-joining DNA ligase [Bacteroidota bacterium]|nr:non-homologous end-joining DNA ligase [Bacteroidota bacterium]
MKNKFYRGGDISVELSHVDKVFWPEEHITKGDIIEYYDKIYPYIIPYLKDRPESLRRNPNGILDRGFFQKNVKEIVPDWAKTIVLYSESAAKDIEYFICNDKASLLYLVNLGCIELNPWNSRISTIDNPDYCILDLDPSEKNTFDDIVKVALAVRRIADVAGIPSFCKTSGATGIHIYIPLGAMYTYEECRAFALLLAKTVVKELPELTTIERSLKKRPPDKIYIDYLQNKKGQTLASAYSVRPRPHATVSTPLEWNEVKTGLRPEQFTIKNIFKRLDKNGDLFAGVLDKGIDLKRALQSLETT